MIQRLFAYLIGGLALVVPFALSAWLLYYLYRSVVAYYPIEYVLLGMLVLVACLIAVGYIASSYIGDRAFTILESILFKTPVIGSIYKMTKDVTGAFVGAENKFSEPVLVHFHEGMYRIGFVTSNDNSDLKNEDSSKGQETLYSVYLPISFSVAGDFFLVASNRLEPIDKTAKEVMQMVVSGGLLKGTNANVE